MEVLSVGGKDYVKASVIARDLGYTADYVGQLCRSRKVNAKLVGRSWYVDRNSIHLHKSNRYRSTQTKTRETLREEVQVVHSLDRGAPVPIHVSHVGKSPKPAYVSYSSDPSDLIPPVSKSPKQTLEVGLADATPVTIKSTSKGYVFETPSLPVIKFKGALTVTNLEEDELSESTDAKVVHPKWIFRKANNKAKNIDSSSVSIKRIDSVAAAHTDVLSNAVPSGDIESVHVAVELNEEVTARPSSLVLFATTVFSMGIVLIMLGLQSDIWVVDQTLTSSYTFAIENLTASVHASVENVKSIFYLVEFSTNFFIF